MQPVQQPFEVKNKPLLWLARAMAIVSAVLLGYIVTIDAPHSEHPVSVVMGLVSLGWGVVAMFLFGWHYDNPPGWARYVVGRQALQDWKFKYLSETGARAKTNWKYVLGWMAVCGLLVLLMPL